jgi:hypothetical protein
VAFPLPLPLWRHVAVRAVDRGVACVEGDACGCGVVGLLEEVRVHVERDAGVGVPELVADEDDVQPAGDQQRGEAVPE